MEEVEDEPLFCGRVAGIDIGKAGVTVTVRVPSETRKAGRQQETREFGTTRRELLALADWLRCWGVERSLQHLGYKVTIEAIDPGTGELQPATTDR